MISVTGLTDGAYSYRVKDPSHPLPQENATVAAYHKQQLVPLTS